jgi:uncharacterized membrane protein
MTLPDIGGLVGVFMMLVAYAMGASGKLKTDELPSLAVNLVGSLMVVVSLLYRFNLPAFIMEASWALVALYGLAKLALRKRR